VIALERHGPVFVLRLDAGENRFTAEAVPEIGRCLDEVEAAADPKALVTTGAGKFYSNGLDLEFMMRPGGDPGAYLSSVHAILARVLAFPAPTVAAVNGHAFGAGALLALAHDFQLMRADRGFFCMPEVDMKAFLHPGMLAILKARLPARTAHEVIATGRRYGGSDASAAGIVHEAVSEAELLPAALARAAALAGKAHPALGRLKRDLHAGALEALVRPLSAMTSAD
jgi:enoyl-CoA hydratase/carnithine racemase